MVKVCRMVGVGVLLGMAAGCESVTALDAKGPEPVVVGYGTEAFTIGKELYSSDFSDKENWTLQIQRMDGSKLKDRVVFGKGMMDLYMPDRGCTAWLDRKFSGPITIVYQVRCPLETLKDDGIQARDINNFWHASDPRKFDAIFDTDASHYNGNFVSYHEMLGYYASTGGGGREGNHTTRFRRYPRWVDGKDVPHIALNDKDENPDYLITPGKWHTVQLVACNGLVQYIVDGKVVYQIKEGDTIAIENPGKKTVEKAYSLKEFPAFTEGYFGLRLVGTHHQYANLRIYRLDPK